MTRAAILICILIHSGGAPVGWVPVGWVPVGWVPIAQALEIAASQGSLVSGELPPGSTIAAKSAKVATYIDPSGKYLLGFAWDAPPVVTLVINGGDEEVVVKRRRFRVEKISDLPESKVTPSAEDMRKIKRDAADINESRRMKIAGFPELGWRLPARGRISGVFGSRRELNGKMRSPHKGLDIAAPAGTAIHAPLRGRIVLAKKDMFYTGNTVIVAHGGGLTSIYAHMDAIAVADGQWVEAGEPLGTIGASGRASGPHLHWGVYLGSVALDPQLLMVQASQVPEGS